MATKIRLSRWGAKKRPYYRIVVANSRAPRDGDFLEKVGTYNPMLNSDDVNRIVLKTDRINYWLSCGAQPTERVAKFLMNAGIALPKSIQKSIDVKIKNYTKKEPKKSNK